MAGWAGVTQLLDSGASWSGHERNIVQMNMGEGRFADFSGTSGGDFADDGRCAATMDLDFDGDVDLVLRNRSTPGLRILRNDAPNLSPGAPAFVAVKLVGERSNRDAIGARVTLTVGDRTLVRTRRTGDGYLSQGSAWLNFGLAGLADDQAPGLVINWPSGRRQEVVLPGPQGFFVIREDGAVESSPPSPTLLLDGSPMDPGENPRKGRILLRSAMPLPAPMLKRLAPDGERLPPSFVLNLWSATCPRCDRTWKQWCGSPSLFEGTSLRVLGISATPEGTSSDAVAAKWAEWTTDSEHADRFRHVEGSKELLDTCDALYRHITGDLTSDLPVPMSLLVSRGKAELLVLGEWSGDQLRADYDRIVGQRLHSALRGLEPGRWYFNSQRNWAGLEGAFKKRGLDEEARWIKAQGR